jgi:hypothetical protein
MYGYLCSKIYLLKAAFQLESQFLGGTLDPRRIVYAITHSPTFVVHVNFSLAVKSSIYNPTSSFHPDIGAIMNNLTDCVLDGLIAVLPNRGDSDLSLPLSIATKLLTSGILFTDGYVFLNCSAYIAAFNASDADSIFDSPAIVSWKSSSIQLFQSRATSPELAEIVSASTFHVLLLTFFLSLSFSRMSHMFDRSFLALPVAAFTGHPSIADHPEIAAPQ